MSDKTGAAAAPAPPKSTGLDMSKLSDPSKYTTPPTEGDYMGDIDSYSPNLGPDESLLDSVINRDDYENYLLICGK